MFCVGLIGHVAHGKSTVVKALSGVQTTRFKEELERNITIKLGYANAKIFRCDNDLCTSPDCYTSFGSSKVISFKKKKQGSKYSNPIFFSYRMILSPAFKPNAVASSKSFGMCLL